MPGLWRNAGARKEKFLVQRRDGTVPEWPYFVLGARDPAAPAALLRYATEARRLGMDEQYCRDVESLAQEFEEYREQHGAGDPDASPHRVDDPAIIAKMFRRG